LCLIAALLVLSIIKPGKVVDVVPELAPAKA
jgi:hypothetical protein